MKAERCERRRTEGNTPEDGGRRQRDSLFPLFPPPTLSEQEEGERSHAQLYLRHFHSSLHPELLAQSANSAGEKLGALPRTEDRGQPGAELGRKLQPL